MQKITKNKSLIAVYFVFSMVFFILLCLGMWQLNKHYVKSFKKNLIESKLNKEHQNLNNFNLEINKAEIIKFRGEILENKSLFFEPRTFRGKIGYHKLVPVKVGKEYVLVNRGFTLVKKKKILTKNKIEYIRGIIINFPKPKFFELKNDIENDYWHTLKMKDISEHLNIKLEPFLIYEINSASNKLINVKPNYLSEINHLKLCNYLVYVSYYFKFYFYFFYKENK